MSQDDFESFTEYYDDKWEEVDGESGSFKVTGIITDPEKKGSCQSMHVVVSTIEDEEIYSLVVEKAVKE